MLRNAWKINIIFQTVASLVRLRRSRCPFWIKWFLLLKVSKVIYDVWMAGQTICTSSGPFTFDRPSFQLYFNEPRICSSRGDTQLPEERRGGIRTMTLSRVQWNRTSPIEFSPSLPMFSLVLKPRAGDNPIRVRNLFLTPSCLVHFHTNTTSWSPGEDFEEVACGSPENRWKFAFCNILQGFVYERYDRHIAKKDK